MRFIAVGNLVVTVCKCVRNINPFVPNAVTFSDVFMGKRKATLGTNGLTKITFMNVVLAFW